MMARRGLLIGLGFAVILLSQCVLSDKAWSQGLCYTKKEVEAEASFRTAIGYREMLRQCAARGIAMESLKDWYAFSSENEERIKAMLEVRAKVIQRLNPANPNAEKFQNDAVIANFAKQELNEGVCAATENAMKEIKRRGWSAFMRYSKLNNSLLQQELPTCPGK